MITKKKKSISIIIFAVLMAASVFCALIVGHAAYSREKYTKRVVTLQSGKGLMFSSDYLITDSNNDDDTSKIMPRIIPFSSTPSGDYVYVDVAICNYQFGEPTSRVSPVDIKYNLKAWLKQESGATVIANQFTISKLDNGSIVNDTTIDLLNSTQGSICYSNETLGKNNRSMNYYRLQFPKDQLSQTNILIVLKSDLVGTYTNYSSSIGNLSAAIGIQKVDLSADRSWNGFVSEYITYGDSNKTPSNFSGFNFIAEGTSSGKITISWDSSVVTLSKYYYKNAGLTGNISPQQINGGNWYKIEIDVNPTLDTGNNKTRYTFEFYRGSKGWEDLGWSAFDTSDAGNAKIKFEFS